MIVKLRNLCKSLSAVLITIFLFTSCQNNSSKSKKNWEKINIRTDFQEITFISNIDTMYRKSWGIKDSFAEPGRVYYVKTDEKTESIYLSDDAKDSVYFLVKEIISKPVKTDKVTCYAGSLALNIESKSENLSRYYGSVGDWTGISKKTRALYNLLKQRTEIDTQ